MRLYHLVSSLTKNPSHMQGTCKKSYYMLCRNATHGALFLQISFWIRHSASWRIALSASIYIDRKIPINLPMAIINLWKLVYHTLSTLLRGLFDNKYHPCLLLFCKHGVSSPKACNPDQYVNNLN